MPWYFYKKGGYLADPVIVGGVTAGQIVGTYLDITETPPTGFLFCNGASVTTAAYPDLFSAIGYKFGGAGANFNLPDFRGRIPRGVASGANVGSVVGIGGAKTHTHTLASHNHTLASHAHSNTTPSHTHSQNHTHDTNEHYHDGSGLNVSGPTVLQSTTFGVDQSSASNTHDHETGGGVPDTVGKTAGSSPTTGGASVTVTGTNSNGGGSNAASASTTSASLSPSMESSLPPYIVNNYLIKT